MRLGPARARDKAAMQFAFRTDIRCCFELLGLDTMHVESVVGRVKWRVLPRLRSMVQRHTYGNVCWCKLM